MADRPAGSVGATVTTPGARALEMRAISKAFHGIPALTDVDFECRHGEIHALVGENGAGKSTLCAILAGATPADAGEISVDGEAVAISGPEAARRIGISMAYQELNLIPHLSAAANIWLHREPRRFGVIDERRLEEKTQVLFADLGIPVSPRASVDRLSITQRQLVEIARAVSLEPRILILDEPTSSLNIDDQARLLALISRLRDRGVVVIYVSHRLDEIFQAADRITVLKDGRRVDTLPVAATTHDQLVRLMVGRDLERKVFPAITSVPGTVVLTVDKLVVRKDRPPISLQLRQGEIVGIAGLAGSGRSSLLSAIYGVQRSFGGTVLVGGVAIRPSPRSSMRRGVAYVGEDRKRDGLAMNLDARTNLTSVAVPSRTGVIRPRAEASQAASLATSVRLPAGMLKKVVAGLSGGSQQKVALGRWLVKPPSVILFDEPTRGIDVGAKAEIYALLRNLAAGGTAVLFVSSEMPEVLGLSDRLLVMREGAVVAEFEERPFSEERIARAMMGVPDPSPESSDAGTQGG